MNFTLEGQDPDTRARTGRLETGHGVIETPVFMPVGTAGTVKAVHQRELEQDVDASIILGNTYHLFLRPGTEILQQAGGLHGFMNWDRNILTDSGGYQVYSLGESRKITEEGVSFKSHIDGSVHMFTPENVMDIQRAIGADIIMAFDECPPYPCDYGYVEQSMEMTHRWLTRCQEHLKTTEPYYGHGQTLFPIVQGGTHKHLRTASTQFVLDTEPEGLAIGGLSVGEPADLMYKMTDAVCEMVPDHLPRYLMGVGTPANILECIALGVDMFDCVMPTRNARNGMLFTTEGIINIRNEKWKNDFSALDAGLTGYVSQHYSKAYLRHLVHSKEILGAQIATLQNLGFYKWLMQEARTRIKEGNFKAWKNQQVNTLMQRL